MPIAPLPHGTVDPTLEPVPGGHFVWPGRAAVPQSPFVPPETFCQPHV